MSAPVPQAIEWAEASLREAYFAVEALLDQHHPETDAHMHLKTALDAIENADVAIEKGH